VELGLAGRSVLVTGGSRGLGRAIAMEFAAEGASVSICARTRNQLDTALEDLQVHTKRAMAIQVDLFEPEGCVEAVERTVGMFGRLDVLINNASTSIAYPGHLEDASDDLLLERVRGKALAAIRCSRAALPHFRRVKGGRIICIGGTAARSISIDPTLGSSVASGLGNALLVNFAKHLSREVAGDGILVNVVHPDAMRTDRYASRVAAVASEMGTTLDKAAEILATRIPIGRSIDPGDVAPLVVFLASSKANAITGQSIGVDGGALAQVIY